LTLKANVVKYLIFPKTVQIAVDNDDILWEFLVAPFSKGGNKGAYVLS